MSEILLDKTFEKGFNVIRRTPKEEIMTISFGGAKPCWRLAEWASKHPLFTHRDVFESKSEYTLQNEAKSIKRSADGSLSISIRTDNEYDHSRKEGEPWPHLLLEQEFEGQKIAPMKRLDLDLSLDFLALESFMNGVRNDLHTLQVSLYFAIGNRNKKSPSYLDFYWFGLPFIDAPRYHFPKKWVNRDLGKEDATRKLIYAIDPAIYMKEPFMVGDRLDVKLDILPFVLEAFEEAKRRGYLGVTTLNELEILSLNLGFEVTGTFNGKIRINRFSINKEEELS